MSNARRRGLFRFPRVSTWIALWVGLVGLGSLAFGVGRLLVPDYLALPNESGDEVSGLVRIVYGILLILLGKALLERRRWAWGAALTVSVVQVALNLYQAIQSGGILWQIPALLVIGALLAFHRRFSVRGSTRLSYGQVVALVAVALALAYGIVGAYLLRDQFQGIQGWSDATYFALVAYVTLDYDYDVAEIYPVGSDARWFVVSMFLIGVTLFVTALSVTLGPIVEGRMKGVMSLVKRFQRLSDHVVLCGYSGVAASVLDELRDRNVMVMISPSTLGGRLLAEQAVNLGAGSGTPAKSQPGT